MNRIQRIRTVLTAACCLAIAAVGPLNAAGCNGLDGDELVSIFGDDAIQVEVNLGGALLGMANKALAEDGDIGSTRLEGINVLIFDLERLEGRDVGARLERARDALRDMEDRLKRRGWERMARVREDGTDLSVLVASEDETTIGGMAVLGIDRDEGTAMFVNLCGVIDLDALDALGDEFDLDLPELEDR